MNCRPDSQLQIALEARMPAGKRPEQLGAAKDSRYEPSMGLRDQHIWRPLYPFESHFFNRNGLRMHYLDEGQGDPVVMLHGNPTWSFYFRELVKALRRHYRCIVPDHIGCGLSDKPTDDTYRYVLQSRVEDLQALLDHLSIQRRATFLVHDWGGMIGMACALWRPERVSRIVVMNTAAFLPPARKPLPWRLRVLHGHNVWSELAVRGLNLFSWPATWMATAKGLTSEVKAGLMAPYRTWADRIAVLRFVQDIPTRLGDPSYDLCRWVDENLHILADRPMLICWGERDFVFDLDYLKEWQRRFPGAQARRFANAGHYVLEDESEEVLTAVKSFLKA